MNRVRRLLPWSSAIVAGAVVASVVIPGHRRVILAVAVMSLLAGMLVAIVAVAYRQAAARGAAWDRVRLVSDLRAERPADLERLERRFGWGRYSTGDFNYRVRPALRRLAAHRLRESRGIDLDGTPEAARPFVSTELWDAVISKRPAVSERVIGTADIERLVDEIEAI